MTVGADCGLKMSSVETWVVVRLKACPAGFVGGKKSRSTSYRAHQGKCTRACLHLHRKSQLFLTVHVDNIRMVGKREKWTK